MRSYKRKILQELELLVIDEISMVRADVLDSVDALLRHVRFRFREPFGGVQVIFIGDMYQLSPVVSEEEWNMLSGFYSSPYFFHSHACQEKQPVYVELDTIFRQSEQRFVNLLNEVRNNCLTRESMKLLQQRYQPDFEIPTDEHWITLTTHNIKADRINALELNQLDTPIKTFKARIEGDFPEKNFPIDFDLQLKEGARVMLIRNDTEHLVQGGAQAFRQRHGIVDGPVVHEEQARLLIHHMAVHRGHFDSVVAECPNHRIDLGAAKNEVPCDREIGRAHV